MTSILIFGVVIIGLAMLASCDSECISDAPCTNSGSVKVSVDVDWSRSQLPDVSGMTAIAYNSMDKAIFKTASNDIDSFDLWLPEGSYGFLVFNHTEEELDCIQFKHLDDLASASVSAVEIDPPAWLDPWAKCIAEPQRLVVGTLESKTVTAKLAEESKGEKCDCAFSDSMDKEGVIVSNLGIVRMKPMTWTIQVRIKIKGIDNLKKARGAISGLSFGRHLALDMPFGISATQLISEWEIEKYGDASGYLCATIECFGLPDDNLGYTLSDGTNTLYTEFLLIDGETVIKDFRSVSAIIGIEDDSNRLTLEFELDDPLPNVKPNAGDGFDASVDSWTNVPTQEFPL